jgi:hypothetical protein
MPNRHSSLLFPSLTEAPGPVTTLARTVRVGVRGLVALLCASLATGVCSAQYRASLQGIVTDPQGAAIPGAILLLTDTSTNHVSKAKSDGHGNYTFNALAADRFSLAVNATGFAPETLSGITLIPEQPNTVNVKLQVGAASESVDVNAGEVPSLDTTTASISGTVTSNQIEHMPSFDRDVFRLAALAPGTFGDEAQSNGGNAKNMPGEDHAGPAATDGGIFETENNPQVIGNGSQVSANNILIDGISTSSANWGGSSVITPSEESVEYLKVTSNAYDAEFGRFSGNAIQITSKSGGNSYHGSAFFKADRPGLNAYQRWNGPNTYDPINAGKSATLRGLVKDTARFNQFGGSIGGPLWRNKLFAFFAYEAFRNGSTSFSQGLYETPSFLAAAPAGSIASTYAKYPGETASATTVAVPASCTVNYGMADGLYCKTLANGQLDIGSPLKTALGNFDPTWSSKTKPGIGAGLDGIGDLQLLSTSNPTTQHGDQYNGRLDGDVTAKDRLSFIIYWVPFNTTAINGADRDANVFNHSQINNAFTALYNRTFSPTLLNEVRASASGWRWNEVNTNPQAPFGLPIDSFVGVGNGTQPANFGPSSPSVFNQWTYAYQDILTKVLGRHNIKAGGTFTNIQFLQEVVDNARPSYTFNSFWDFLNDAPFSEKATFNPVTGTPGLNRQDERLNIFGTFAQDDFKVTPNLTLNLGLRWNYFGPFHNKQNNLSVITPGAGAAMLTGLTMTQGGNLYSVQKGNFGPQVGFAWTPASLHHGVVFRGGVGINYNEDEFAITVQGNANSPTLLNITPSGYSSKNPNILYAIASDVHTPLAYPSNPHAITSFGANGLPNLGLSVNVTGNDPNVKTITVYHYSLDTEMTLPAHFVATLGYQGSSGHHLLYEKDLNAVAVVQGYALNPALSRVTLNSNGANSNYSAMLATIKHNFSHSFQIEGQYTWSKSMDEGSSPFTIDPYAPISIHQVYGRSDYNVQNAFRTFGLYQPNFFHEKWLHTFADGWSLGGIYNWHTGFPWTPSYSVTTNNQPTGTAGALYYAGSPYSTIRPAAYTGTGIMNMSTLAFETAPTLSDPSARNVNFPNGGPAYFVEPTYNAALKTAAYSATQTFGIPGRAMERNSFNGPMYQDLDVSITKGFNLPETPVIGSKAHLEFRVDAYNVFNLVSLTPTPTTSITSTSFGANGSALGSRTVQIQTRFSF